MARINLRSCPRPRLHRPQFLAGIPVATIRIISLLVVVNIIVWIVAGIVLHYNPTLIGAAALSYALGLRHALDADHISAIDLMTRRLIASGQKPVTVGTFFSLGHSTIVIVTCIVVAATSGALRDRFDDFTRVGNIIGTSISATFLLALSLGNGWVLWRLVKRLQLVLEQQRRRDAGLEEDDVDLSATANPLDGVGFMSRIFKRLFVIVDKPWKMYPMGVIFGLGFDTSSEIAILGIASIQGAAGTSLWVILIFPALFTAGMCMVDTADGSLMMALYTNKAFARDQVAILYYSIVLTGITVFVSAFIGVIQVLSLAQNIAEPEGSFWDGVSVIGDHFDIIGGSICGLFVVVGLGSVIVYKPWRRRMDRAAMGRPQLISDEEVEDGADLRPAEDNDMAPVEASPLPNKSVAHVSEEAGPLPSKSVVAVSAGPATKSTDE